MMSDDDVHEEIAQLNSSNNDGLIDDNDDDRLLPYSASPLCTTLW